ncbi:MAG TPA: hypothetical protein VK904_01590 [Miltoncostaeaceae bacterium]|nr:hypothetical protein [Miltoncostaeaceae bacterium]
MVGLVVHGLRVRNHDRPRAGGVLPVAHAREREHELAAQAAADAPVREAHGVAVASAHQLGVDVDRAEVVDQDAQAAAAVAQHRFSSVVFPAPRYPPITVREIAPPAGLRPSARPALDTARD